MSDTPCPPYYTPPTTEVTLFFSTNDYVRNYNDWYQCIHPAYCNTPLFLGYNPPGIGEHSDEAWLQLEEGFPCNPNLTPSVSNSIGGGFSNVDANGIGGGGLILTRRPTSSPTTKNELPSLISGKIWYDANGDGRRNTLTNALTVTDFEAGEQERGSGVANMKVYLRYCRTGELAAVTYTYPREWEGSGGGGGSGGGSSGVIGEAEDDSSEGANVQVLGTDYLESIYADQNVNIPTGGGGGGNGGDGVDSSSKEEIGHYQFIILPFQIPGKFYVVFEAPPGYRITTGTGQYWEVQEEAKNDDIFPLMEKPKDGLVVDRYLQDDGNVTQSTLEGGNDTASNIETVNENETDGYNYEEDDSDFIPINHSGYYARSRECFSIQKSPTQFLDIDAGLAMETWPMNPFQYASFLLSIQFYLPDARRHLKPHGNKRKRELATGVTKNRPHHSRELQSLECREYQKLKSEGIEVEDIWGCEAPMGNIPLQYEFAELTAEEADEVVNGVKDFMTPRLDRKVVLKNVGLAHQKLIIVDDDSRRLLTGQTYGYDQNNEFLSEFEDDGLEDDRFIVKFWNWIFGSLFEEKETSGITRKISGNTYRLRRGTGINTHLQDATHRELQSNKEIALLELGFRIRAEYEAGSNIDLQKSAIGSILSDVTSFLGVFKASKSLPPFFKLAGGVKIRDVLEVPKVEEVVVEEPIIEQVVEPVVVEEESGLPLFLIIGIVVGSVVVLALLGMAAYLLRVKRMAKQKQLDDDSSSYDSSSYESNEYESDSNSDSSSSSSAAGNSSSEDESSSDDDADGGVDESSTSEEGSSSGDEGNDDDESSSENARSPPSVGRLNQHRMIGKVGSMNRQSTRSKTPSQVSRSQSTRSRSIKSQSSRSWSMKSQSTRTQSVRSQSLMSQSTRSQSVRSQSTRSQSVRSQSTRSQSVRSQSTRSQSVRSQSTRSQSTRPQSVRSQSTRSQSTRSQSAKSRLSSIRSSVGSRTSGITVYSSSSSMTPHKKLGGQMT